MTQAPQISDAEWEVMNLVWDKPPVTANDLIEVLSPRSGWHPKTIKTMLNRLVKKGALGYQEEGNRYLYYPNVSREACVREESHSFLKRVFGGAASPMLVHFVQNTPLSPMEIEELKRILESKET